VSFALSHLLHDDTSPSLSKLREFVLLEHWCKVFVQFACVPFEERRETNTSSNTFFGFQEGLASFGKD
jgi:hypothetical protein